MNSKEQLRLIEASPNFFSGSNLNRVSERRTDNVFLSEALTSSNSHFLLLSNGNPLAKPKPTKLHWLSYKEVEDIIRNPFIDKEKQEYPEGVTLIFLGIDKSQNGDTSSRWALDISPKGPIEDSFMPLRQKVMDEGYMFIPLRPKSFKLPLIEAAILAQARSMIDWNTRNRYCPACGRKTVLTDAGYKRTCLPSPLSQATDERPPCISPKGAHNFSYPRTDPVVIICTISQRGDKILLGRQKSWPAGMYSCVAGFIEPGESLEEAARREVREETGITLGPVIYHSSQPWPFPNSLMIGCIGRALSEKIQLEDMELDDARWFTRQEVLDGLQNPVEITTRATLDPHQLRLPPGTAIAHQIIRTWAKSEIMTTSKI
ncbi:NADH pyrophosphatase [Basidiobolus ranarum]|uniref:NAD(+) diphosphatase n=1 Tax=Basidiobolus ranarum TaxID=34480 RepID=A0ABR2WL01_9FUNG